ncbi:hypothetical protein [Streptomyces sp. NPDC101145]|uniref:hypothetical protein n=1 Tax=Streptomyces sp. NPDC101145 TaxID=3366112 RepID=UPI0038288C2D
MTTDIGRKLAQLEKRLAAVERQSRLGSASVDNTALEIRDQAGSLRGLIGQQADGTTAVNITNGPTPPAPSTPNVAPALGGIAVTWDGTFADGAPAPLDWSRVEVHASTTAGFTPTPDTLQATIETPQGAVAYIPATTPQYVLLLSRNTSGTASTPTMVVGPYEARPVADDIGPGGITTTHIADEAVTTPKVHANAIVTAHLAAGSVDATALKADAITGKTITGGTVTGATVQTSGTGQRLVLNPNSVDPEDPLNSLPAVELHSGAAAQLTPGYLSAKVSDETPARPYVSLRSPAVDSAGPGLDNPELPIDSELRLFSAQPGSLGGSFSLNANPNPYADEYGVAYIRGAVAKDTVGTSLIDLTCFDGDDAPGGSGIQGPGTSLKMQGTEIRFRAQRSSPSGDFSATITPDGLSLSDTKWTPYTPVVAGGGTATYSSRTGWYWKLGKLVFFNCEFTVNAAGSGTSIVTVTAPTAIDRSSRQVMPLHAKGAWTSGMAANGNAVSLETGSGNVIDHLSLSNDNAQNRDGILTGVNLLSTARISISGWYREA